MNLQRRCFNSSQPSCTMRTRRLLAVSRLAANSLAMSIFILIFASGCSEHTPWNMPYPGSQAEDNALYAAFSEQPKHLDPAQSYSQDEYIFLGQIYEPPLQYDLLKRPYTLIPLTTTERPTVRYYDKSGKLLPDNASSDAIAQSVYLITIKPGILYQPHPSLAKNEAGEYRYLKLQPVDLKNISTLNDFPYTGTRELTADDYVYQIKRIADPHLNSPIASVMNRYILGLEDYNKQLTSAWHHESGLWLDLRKYDLPGVRVINKYQYEIILKGKYQQFIYWLAMPFFAPIPWEADNFYNQPGMLARNITLDWYPIGTGPYLLQENNPNRQMVLSKNPNFHPEYSSTGKLLPHVDKVILSLEKESIPLWTKFLQGYYDQSGISSDTFDQAIRLGDSGSVSLTDEMVKKGMFLNTDIAPSIFYMGFNMLDDVVGSNTESQKKLRQAISIAVNMEEYIAIFLNGRAQVAQGPIPVGIFGYQSGQAGINPIVYEWKNGSAQRRPLADAKKLLKEAGYPDGRVNKTDEPLVLHMSLVAGNNTDEQALNTWLKEQFAKLGIDLQIESTQYNRFQDKMQKGDAQLFFWGWNADYPDPENFLFLLYSKNSMAKYAGQNTSNYNNPQYDAMFLKMRDMADTPERQTLINQMVDLLRKDAPWIWGVLPQTITLSHQWNNHLPPNPMVNNGLKYREIDPVLRAKLRLEWNQPIIWPVVLGVIGLLAVAFGIGYALWKKQHRLVPRV